MNDKPDDAASLGASAQGDVSAPAQPDAGQAADQVLQAFAELKAENADLRDKLLRNMAETENFRRRAEREKNDVSKYAVTEFARDIVSIGDNLRRAIEAVQKEPLDQNPALKTLLEGVEVTERELLKVFERHGVTRFDPLGEKFDPHVHEAMIKVDVPNVSADIIVQVLQAGYKINDRVLRPAAVIVAKGGTVVQPQQERSAAPDPAPEPAPRDGVENVAANGETREASHGGEVKQFHEHDPDILREATGAPKGERAHPRKERAAGEKRVSSVTKPITDNSPPLKKDDLISSFGKRLENGN